ncbi:MAG TPA: DUF4019 domain-containing protein [Chthoniobacterales bacterium]|nr:DUF4019 domain-containing protein [Chthoniobacterales bacterium]
MIGASALIWSFPAAATPLNNDAAREAAMQWLQLIDAGRYQEAASQGSQEVRGFEQWINQFKTQRAALSRVNKRQPSGIRRAAILAGVPEVRSYFFVRFKTAFEHQPMAIEEVTLARIGCCWEVFEYKVE